MNGKRLPCILCVDDEPQILDGLALLLQRDYRVMTAPGGKAALEKVREFGPPAVILTDMRMPGMDGAHLLKTMSLLYPETTRILLTGDPSRDAAIAAINEGKIFRFLTKPCAPDQVRAAIEAGVTHHQLMTAERAILQAAPVARSAVAGRSEESPLANSLMTRLPKLPRTAIGIPSTTRWRGCSWSSSTRSRRRCTDSSTIVE